MFNGVFVCRNMDVTAFRHTNTIQYYNPPMNLSPMPLNTIPCGKAVGVIRLRVTERSIGYQKNTAMYNLKLAVAVVPYC